MTRVLGLDEKTDGGFLAVAPQAGVEENIAVAMRRLDNETIKVGITEYFLLFPTFSYFFLLFH